MNRLVANPTVILVGKTNVGKSTLFNRLSSKRLNIAHKTPGATRDCIFSQVDFSGNVINLSDSGGIERKSENNPFQSLVSKRVLDTIEAKADVVLFLVSAKDGLTMQDLEICRMIRKLNKPTILVINKVDHENNEILTHDYAKLGFKDPIAISAAQNKGIAELKLKVLNKLNLKLKKEYNETSLSLVGNFVDDGEGDFEKNDGKIKFCVVGKPNAGKSTLVNAILNEDRIMVSSTPGTTVDAIDTEFHYKNQDICLIDTAGIRRQRSVDEEIEKMAIARTLCAIDRSQVAILLINGQEPVSEQDKKIAGIILEKKKACVIVVNKWDEEVRSESSKDKYLDDLRFQLPFLSFSPVVFISAKYGNKIFNSIDKALILASRFKTSINTSKVNRVLEKAVAQHQPPVFMGKRLKMNFATQIDHSPPTFVISCSKPNGVHFSYKRYLINFFRDGLGLGEIPIRIIFRNKSDDRPYSRESR